MFRQWKNSDEVIDWFEKINKKNRKRFVNFVIKNFYPTIKRKYLIDAIYFSNSFSKFTKFEIDTTMQTCKSFMLYDNTMWK